MSFSFKRRLAAIRPLFVAVRSAKLLAAILRTNDARGRNRLLCELSATLGMERSLGRPVLLNIEPSTYCDQRCPVCETGAGILERPRRHLPLEDFRTILDRFDDTLEEIFFYFMGESFLNPDCYEMIAAAAERGIFVSSCTNGNAIVPDRLVASGIADIQFQIAGLTQETHETYRKGGNLERVLDNVRETLVARERTGENRPGGRPLTVGLGFIAFRHNEHELPMLAEFAKKLGVDEHQVIPPVVRTPDQADTMLPMDPALRRYDDDALARGRLTLRSSLVQPCHWLHSTMTILVSGDAVPCCHDPHGRIQLGNLLQQPLGTIWNGKPYRRIRRLLRSRENLPLCRLCEGYPMPTRR